MNKFVAIVLSAAIVSPAFAEESGYETKPAVYRDAKNAGYNKSDVHKYWDGEKAEKFEAKSSCVSSNFDIPQEYMNPELMALGDSLYNGVQSLRINWWLSEWSVPSYVAIAMGLIDEKNGDRTGKRMFYGPQYPSHDASPSLTISYGLNLEALQWSDLTGAAREQGEHLYDMAFRKMPPNKRAFVDNLAVSGFNTSDLYAWKAKDYKTASKISLAQLRKGRFAALADAFFYSNAYYVLNPTKSKCIDQLSALDQVKLRKPKRLIVNIGSNNGLYLMSFMAKSVDTKVCLSGGLDRQEGRTRCRARTIREFLGARYQADIKYLFDELSKVDGLEYVFFNGIGLPSQPANLEYRSGEYRSALFGNSSLTAMQVEEGDKLARAANRYASSLGKEYSSRSQGPKFVFIDVASTLARYDYKGCLRRLSVEICKATRTFEVKRSEFGLPAGPVLMFDNRPQLPFGQFGYVTGTSFSNKLRQGGLFSFDNMHLSSVGYELMANAVINEVKKPENGGEEFTYHGPSCKRTGNEVGACRNLLVRPGWSFADATRREFNFLRVGGEANSNRRAFVRFVANLVGAFD
ncbi:hypothetical protein [Rhizobium sp. UGM030330-04]|uniref:hypothetical protein n=1 Tax=Rhizobium sp. UGM030330-04 TaxID=1378077 RepID=UPI000D855810|nr:hypothetical protein [Rhizobium sp. UGM030330-04]PYG54293.1 hypothetical protein N434_04654 [Rhizobium sp. UGM030330-04]